MSQREYESDRKKHRGRIKKAIAGAAPGLARALGGPLAGSAVGAIAKAVLGKEVASEGELERALEQARPEQFVALKQADHDFKIALRHEAAREAQIAADDRANARARQQAMGDKTPAILGGLIITGFFVVLAAMVTRRLPAGAETEFAIMLGALATMTAAVVNYFFGSSAGSKAKTELMSGVHGFPELSRVTRAPNTQRNQAQ